MSKREPFLYVVEALIKFYGTDDFPPETEKCVRSWKNDSSLDTTSMCLQLSFLACYELFPKFVILR